MKWFLGVLVLSSFASAADFETEIAQAIAVQLGKSPVTVTSSGFTADSVDLPLKPHVFSADTWAPLAAKSGAITSATTEPLLPTLERSISMGTLRTEATTVAEGLRKLPRSAELHEKAALLLVALALRDVGAIGEPHEALAAATAHLAIARVSNRELTVDGRAAQAFIHALVGDEASALKLLDAKRSQSWEKAVEVLVTGDWRLPKNTAPLNGFERVARTRELRIRTRPLVARDADDAWGKLDDALWARTVYLTGAQQSVLDANLDGLRLSRAETAELEIIRGMKTDEVFPPQLLQQHMLRNAIGAAIVEYTALEQSLGRRAAATERLRTADAEFGDEGLWLAVRMTLGDKPIPGACGLGKAHVEQLRPGLRWYAAKRCGLPPVSWKGLIPRNTAYKADGRLVLAAKQMPELLTLAPHDFFVLNAKYENSGGDLEEFKPLADYDMRVLFIASKKSPSKEVFERMCELDADSCDDLVNYLRENQLDAVPVLERWRKHPRSSVSFSERARPLLDAYFEQKRFDDAADLAREVEAVGSSRGMEIAAVFAERMGRYEVAERKFRAVAKRYDRPDFIDDFYIRAAFRKYPGDWDTTEAVQRTFKGPMELVTAAQLKPSDRGVRMGEERDPAYRHFGIKKGDVVLALDGVRVRDMTQLLIIAHRSGAPTLNAVVVRDGKVLELDGPFNRQRYER